MALDRIYRLLPAADTPVAEAVAVWAQHAFQSGLATVGEPVDVGGVLYAPMSTVVIRVRYRTDVATSVSRFLDRDGRVWRVGETVEVGRRQFLDCAISTYDIPSDADDDGGGDSGFVPPDGWYLQTRAGVDLHATSGRYVDTLIVRATRESGDGFLEFDVTIPSPGWAVARGLDQWHGGTGTFGDSIPATSPGSTLASIGTRPISARQVSANLFDSGTAFPSASDAIFVALPSGFGVVNLVPGAVITIGSGRLTCQHSASKS